MQTLIDLQTITKSYLKRGSKEKVAAVKGISFQINPGEIVGLLGPNGAGKTTTIKMVCGLIKPDAGTVKVKGFDIVKERQRAMRSISAVLEGNRNLYWRLTVKENLEYFAGNRGHSRREVSQEVERLIEQFRLESKRDELVNNLSRGMQQKLAIAVAMLAGTEAILLDEPTLGLDVETGYEVRDLLRAIAQEGRTVIISTHDMPVVQDLCERSIIINAGQVVVDDRVDSLLRLLETKAYEVKLGTALSPAQIARLKGTFKVLTLAENVHSFKVTLEHDDAIYTLMDILRLEHTPVEAIDRTNIHFEQVFRQLVKGRKETDYVLA